MNTFEINIIETVITDSTKEELKEKIAKEYKNYAHKTMVKEKKIKTPDELAKIVAQMSIDFLNERMNHADMEEVEFCNKFYATETNVNIDKFSKTELAELVSYLSVSFTKAMAL